MDFPSVTVVIPCYNASSYIEESIECLLQQGYPSMHILVVDDGSTDGSQDKVRQYETVSLIEQDHQGISYARNTGVRHVHTPYIAFHDADDVCEPDRIERQMSLLLKAPHLDYVLCQIQNFMDSSVVQEENHEASRFLPRLGFVSSMVARRKIFDSVGLFNESFPIGEDIEWLIRAEKHCHCTVPSVLIHRRLHQANSTSDLSLNRQTLFQVLRLHLRKTQDDV